MCCCAKKQNTAHPCHRPNFYPGSIPFHFLLFLDDSSTTHRSSTVQVSVPERLAHNADRADFANHVALGISTDCGPSKASTAHHQREVLARALSAGAGGEALCAGEPVSLRSGGEDGVVPDSELNRAVAPCVGLSCQGAELVLCPWAEGHGLGKLGGLAGERGAETCASCTVLSDCVHGDGGVELADEPAGGAVVGLDVEGWREDEVAVVAACCVDLGLGGEDAGAAETVEWCAGGCAGGVRSARGGDV